MKEVVNSNICNLPSIVNYIPHQAVFNENSSTTKIRVVFDTSRKSSNGLSLNEQTHIGPRLQQDLTSIIMRWRKHAIVFTAATLKKCIDKFKWILSIGIYKEYYNVK